MAKTASIDIRKTAAGFGGSKPAAITAGDCIRKTDAGRGSKTVAKAAGADIRKAAGRGK